MGGWTGLAGLPFEYDDKGNQNEIHGCSVVRLLDWLVNRATNRPSNKQTKSQTIVRMEREKSITVITVIFILLHSFSLKEHNNEIKIICRTVSVELFYFIYIFLFFHFDKIVYLRNTTLHTNRHRQQHNTTSCLCLFIYYFKILILNSFTNRVTSLIIVLSTSPHSYRYLLFYTETEYIHSAVTAYSRSDNMY